VSDLSERDQPLVDPQVRISQLEQQMEEVRRETEKQVLRANLRLEAVRAGMVDLDGIKLIDTGSIRLTEDGQIEGGGELMQRLKRQKPWLFGAGSTSAPADAPPQQRPRPKTAMEMTDEEYKLARAQLLKRAT
jgi:hypothetical protein